MRFLIDKIRYFTFVICVFLFAELAHAQTPGLTEVQQKLASSPAGSSVRIIGRARPAASQIDALGRANAMREAAQQAISKIRQLGVPSADHIGGTDLVVLQVTEAQLAKIEQEQLFSAYELDTDVHPNLLTVVPAIGADTLHVNNARGLGSLVVIVDTGVDRNHPFLANRVVDEACFSTNDPGRQVTSTCSGGATVLTGAGTAPPCSVQGCDHGTHVSGIAAGNVVNRTGIAPDASIAAIQAFSVFAQADDCKPRPAPCPKTFSSDQIRALVHVRDVLAPRYAVSAVNMSLGGGNFTAYCASDARAGIISELRQLGIATIVSSGNDGFTNAVGSPACIESALTVGATLNTNPASSTVWTNSNSSEGIDLLAPGANVVSSVPNGGYATFSGTSMAAPAVSGLIAALRSAFYVNADTAEATLKSTGVAVTDTRNSIQRPRINAQAAYNSLEAARPADAFIWMKDTWSDSGLEPDPATAGQPMSGSPFIWVRNQDDGAVPLNHHQHQNPEFGQPNFIYVKLLNTGRASGSGTISLFVSNASPNPNVPSAWTRLVDAPLTIAPRLEAVYKFPWLNVPVPGHYCLMAKFTPSGGDTSLQFDNVDAAVRSSRGLIWKNINIVDLAANTAVNTKFEWRKGTSGSQSNFAFEVKGSRGRNSVLRVRLPKDLASLLREEPTLFGVTFEEEGEFVDTTIVLSDGVYYFPLPEKAAPPSVEVPLSFRKVERVSERMNVTLFQVEDIHEHKRKGVGVIGTVTYQIQ